MLRGQYPQRDISFTIQDLNSCFAGSGQPSLDHASINFYNDNAIRALSAAQAQVLDHIRSTVSFLGAPPGDLATAGTLAELGGTVSGYSCTPKYSREL